MSGATLPPSLLVSPPPSLPTCLNPVLHYPALPALLCPRPSNFVSSHICLLCFSSTTHQPILPLPTYPVLPQSPCPLPTSLLPVPLPHPASPQLSQPWPNPAPPWLTMTCTAPARPAPPHPILPHPAPSCPTLPRPAPPRPAPPRPAPPRPALTHRSRSRCHSLSRWSSFRFRRTSSRRWPPGPSRSRRRSARTTWTSSRRSRDDRLPGKGHAKRRQTQRRGRVCEEAPVSLCVCVCVCVCACVCVCGCVWRLCAAACVRVCCLSARTCVSQCVRVCACVCVRAFEFICMTAKTIELDTHCASSNRRRLCVTLRHT